MSFTSFQFLWMFPLFVLLYNIVSKKFRQLFLLVASYVFYINMQPILFVLLLAVSLITYLFAKKISLLEDDRKRGLWLKGGIISILLPLLFFKYFKFLANSLILGLSHINLEIHPITLQIALPIGISFYTFMAIGYLIDIFNEDIEFEPNYITTSLFLAFFPYILSGPIERANNMFTQFKHLKSSTWDLIISGLKLMLWGYFMKLCIADRLALYNNIIFDGVKYYSGSTLALASLLYPIQVYADLGGYTLIVMGISRCLGINIIPNFNRPFFSLSVSAFWRRWHMSFIQWLTDYIYTPFSFILRDWKIYGIILSLMLTFFIGGIWHGATFSFIFWGLLQGLILSFEVITKHKRDSLEKKYDLTHKWWYIISCIIGVYLIFAFTEIWDKEGVVWNDSILILHKIFYEWGTLYFPIRILLYAFGGMILLFLSELRDEFFPTKFLMFKNKNLGVRWFSYISLIFVILLFGVLNNSQFIYYKF